MENEMRKLIDQVKNFGGKLNENTEIEPDSVNGIIYVLGKYDIKVSGKEDFYNGANYGEKYTIIDSDDVDGKTPYMGIPTKVKSQGFITRNGKLQNYFFHTGEGFETTKSINEFLRALGK